MHQFNDEGTYYFTSGEVYANGIEFRGVIEVTPKMSLLGNVSVRVFGQDAKLNENSGKC